MDAQNQGLRNAISENFVQKLWEATCTIVEWSAGTTYGGEMGKVSVSFPSFVFEECKRVFFRLTAHPDGSFVSLWDLVDTYGEKPFGTFVGKMGVYENVKKIYEAVGRETAFPVKYDFVNAVFIKEPETFSIIHELNVQFARWEEKIKDPQNKER